MRVKIVAMIVLVAGLLVLAPPAPSESQVDLSKILVGKWQGEFAPPRGGRREQHVLVFESVRQQGGGWVATAKFGPSEGSLFPVNVTLEVAGSEVRVRFKAPGGRGEADLTMRGDNQLAGTFKIATGQGWLEVPMTLNKAK